MSDQGVRHDEIQGAILHEYDGIEEADNQLPLWWVTVFVASVAFAVFYWLGYEVYGMGETPEERYAARLQELEQLRAEQAAKMVVSEPILLAMARDEGSLAAGAVVFRQNCVACHLERGQGSIGPNLTDKFWIHGGKPMQIHHTIQAGVPEKGMPPWGSMLGAKAVQDVTAFVLSLRGTAVPGKAPEGQPLPD